MASSSDGWGQLADAFGGIAQNLGSYFMQQQQVKQQIKLAKAMSGGSQLPGMAMGYSAAPLTGWGSPVGIPGSIPFGMNMGQPVLSGGSSTALPAMPGAGGAMGPVMGTGARVPTQYIVLQTPSGRQVVTGVRSLGRPLLWSGDLAAVKRVGRIARKLGRFHRRRPR